MASDALIVRESFIGRVKDEERLFREGELIRANDPAVAKWPDKFGSPEFRHEVEQATAAPGEKRHIRLPRRTKPRKATPAEEKAIAATVKAEAKAEPDAVDAFNATIEPTGHAITTADIESV
jgi:hypothetical protein